MKENIKKRKNVKTTPVKIQPMIWSLNESLNASKIITSMKIQVNYSLFLFLKI